MKANTIKDFIKKVSLGGTMLPYFALQPAGENTKIVAKSIDNTSMVTATLKGLKLTETYYIKNTIKFISALEFVGGDITFKKSDTQLCIYSDDNGVIKKWFIGLTDEENINDVIIDENIINEKFMVSKEGAIVPTDLLKSLVKNFKTLGEGKIEIIIKDKRLLLKQEGDTDVVEIDTVVEHLDAVTAVGLPFVNICMELSEKTTTLFLNSEIDFFPLRIQEKTENSTIDYIIAPRVDIEQGE